MIRRFLPLVLLATMATALPCWAAPAAITPEARQSDAELNRLYKQVLQRLSYNGATKKAFIDAQLAWLKYRDAECIAVSKSALEPNVAYANRQKTLTEARCRDFRDWYLTSE